MTKKDVIIFDKREELAENHPFLRTELGQYAFQLGFDAAAESIIERACEWLADNYIKECGYLGAGEAIISFNTKPAIEAFRKAMEEWL